MSVKVPLFNSDLRGSPGLQTDPSPPANIFDLQAQSIYCENASFSTGVKSDEFCQSASAIAENPCRCRDFVQFG